MTEVDGRRLRGDRARVMILSCSTHVASTEGVEGITIGRIANDAGIPKGNIQTLFGDRETLQIETIQAAVDVYRRAVIDPALSEPSALGKLWSMVDGWFDFVEDRVLPGGCFVSAASSEMRARPGRLRDRIKEHRNSVRSRFNDLVLQGKQTGEIASDVDVSRVVFELVAHRAAANVASLMDDADEFAQARKASRDLIRSISVSGRLPRIGGKISRRRAAS